MVAQSEWVALIDDSIWPPYCRSIVLGFSCIFCTAFCISSALFRPGSSILSISEWSLALMRLCTSEYAACMFGSFVDTGVGFDQALGAAL